MTHHSVRPALPRLISGCAAALSLTLAASTSALAAPLDRADASAAGEAVVINEVYTTGAGPGAAFDQRFIELHNPTDADVSLDGWSLSYRPAGRDASTLRPSGHVVLEGTIDAGGHYLISNPGLSAGDGEPLPEPDAHLSGSAAMRDGVLWLSSTEQRLEVPLGDVQDHAEVVDLIGYGTANTFETAPADSVSGSSDVRSMARDDGADTDDNSTDFTLSETITPTNSSGEQAEHSPEEVERQEPEELAIAEIPRALPGETEGGDLDEELAALLEQPVTTRGVVTAAYPSRGFDGFVIQTEGTGGDLTLDPEAEDAHTASDGIFVYSLWRAEDVEVGDFVELTADVTVYSGQVQLSLYPGSEQTPEHELTTLESEPHEEVKPAAVEVPETPEQRLTLQGMLLDPQGEYRVTDHYTLNQYGEVGIVSGESPLVNPTSVHRPGPEAEALAAQNRQRLIYLDDGATTNFSRSPGWDQPLPYVTAEEPVRIGAEVDWRQHVIMDHRFDEWRLQPTAPLTAQSAEAVQPAEFEDTRAEQSAPQPRSGDLRLAGFNVLNYFVSLGEDEPGCQYYSDREGNPTTTDWCEVRGAYSQESVERQESKIVEAISAMDADVVALQEMENSARFTEDGDRDLAHGRLVEALNEHAGGEVWDFVDSPETTPAPEEEEDVIRNGFIYRTDAVEPVGEPVILFDEGVEDIMTEELEALDLAAIYDNAREPLAQEFRPVGEGDGGDDESFIAIVKHFKSKGSAPDDGGANADSGDGQGAWNADRVEQAEGLVAFSEALQSATGTEQVYLMGDFNSYEQEDPLQVLQEADYTNLSAQTGQHSYHYDAAVGSLDHVFASPEAAETVTGTQVWNINAVEPIALEYSRYNGNASDLFRMDMWRSSDHDPILTDISLDGTGGDGPDQGGPDGDGEGTWPPRGPGNDAGSPPGDNSGVGPDGDRGVGPDGDRGRGQGRED